jgi:hypothetical protein
MGLLNFLKKDANSNLSPGLIRLPSGSYTIDGNGKVVVSTLPRDFPEPIIKQISQHVITAFRQARETQLPLSELVVHFSSLRLTARELRGGAIIFLAPRSLDKK